MQEIICRASVAEALDRKKKKNEKAKSFAKMIVFMLYWFLHSGACSPLAGC